MPKNIAKPIHSDANGKYIDWNIAEQHLASFKEKIFSFVGKAGYNPYIWWSITGAKYAEEKLKAGHKTLNLYNTILALQYSPPLAR